MRQGTIGTIHTRAEGAPMKSAVLISVLFLALSLVCISMAAAAEEPLNPEEIVTLFHETYGTAWMDDIGPYTTARFRNNLPITVWIIDAWDWLQDMAYEKLDFKITESRINEDGDYATVVSRTRVRTTEGETEQNEIFILLKDEDLWYIDEMYVTDENPGEEEQRL
jgi:hypothetical protein